MVGAHRGGALLLRLLGLQRGRDALVLLEEGLVDAVLELELLQLPLHRVQLRREVLVVVAIPVHFAGPRVLFGSWSACPQQAALAL